MSSKRKMRRLRYFTADDGICLQYVDCFDETAVPLVFLHGLAGKGREFQPVAAELASDFRVIRFDYRGHGSNRRYPFSQKQAACDLQSLLEHLSLNGVVLVGSSLGVHVIFRYLQDFGDSRIQQAVLIDMSPRLLSNEEWKYGFLQGAYRETTYIMDAAIRRENPTLFRGLLIQRYLFKGAWDCCEPEKVNLLHKILGRFLMPKIIVETWEDLFEQDYRSVLPEIRIPVIILYADPGNLYNRETAEYIAEEIPDSRLFPLKDTVHQTVFRQSDYIASVIKTCLPRNMRDSNSRKET